MAADGPSAAWLAMRDAPLWICTGGPLDGATLTSQFSAGVFRDSKCVEAGGYCVLKTKQEGRYHVPTAVWQLDERPKT